MSLIGYCYGNNNKLRLVLSLIDIHGMNMCMRYKSNLYPNNRGRSFFRKAAPLKIRINQGADFEGLTNRSTRGKFRLPFLRFL